QGDRRQFGARRLQPSARRTLGPVRGEDSRSALMETLLAQPRGFCAGVDRAIEIVERALERFGAPIYVRHEIVHNAHVVNDLRGKGAIFVEDLDEIGRASCRERVEEWAAGGAVNQTKPSPLT